MANFPFKMLVSLLQKRFLQTKASTLVKPYSNPVKIAAEIQSKTKDSVQTLLSVGERGQSVIALLKSQHFSDTQIAKLIERSPGILSSRVSSNLEPKLKFLNKNGFTGSLLPQVILSNPIILRRSLKFHLVPSIEFLKSQLGKDNENALHMVIKRASWVLTSDLDKVLRPNLVALEKEGMPMSSILKLFTTHPRSLLRNIERVLSALENVKRFGIKPNEPMFVHALRVMLSMDESSLKKKLEVFKRLGWSDADILSCIVRQPLCLTCSEEKLKGNVDYLVKTMKVEPDCIIANPKMVMYSLNKRIIPRCNVLNLLQEKRLVWSKTVSSILNISERDFVRQYIVKYIDYVPHLWDVYRGDSKLDVVAVKQ